MINLTSKIILPLIKAEMKNYKLIKGLDRTGVLSEDFYLDLDKVILDLLNVEDIDDRESLYKIYDKHLDKIIELHVHFFFENLNDLALELYIDLKAEKKVMEKLKNLPEHNEVN